MKVLILHGWMHQPELYSQLLVDFPDININLYHYKVYRKSVLNNLARDLAEELHKTHYDLIIAHSMGCNILLRVGDLKSRVILLSPVYGHIFWALPLVPFIGCKFKPLLYFACRLTVYKSNERIDDLVECSLSWDSVMARRSLLELVFTRVSNKGYTTIKGSKDWISNSKADIVLTNVGHTIITEDYDYIRRLLELWRKNT